MARFFPGITIFSSLFFYYEARRDVETWGLIPIASKDFKPMTEVERCARGASKCKNRGINSLKVTQ